MTNSHIHAALARERVRTLLAEADTARRAGQARQARQRAAASGARQPQRHRPLGWLIARVSLPGHRPRSAVPGSRVALRDGSAVLIRQVQPADAPLPADGFSWAMTRQQHSVRVHPEEAVPSGS